MKIALIQSNPTTGALRGNADALMSAALKARDEGAALCVAPELALCGHNAGDLLLRSDFAAACRQTLDDMAGALHTARIPLLLGAPVANPAPQGKPLQNCAVLLRDGKVSVISRKALLPCEGVFADARYFEPGLACGVLQHNGWRFLIAVGQDAWNDSDFKHERRNSASGLVADFMAGGGADGLINLTALPYAGDAALLHRRMQCRTAARYRIPVLVANCVGGNDTLIYYGGSLACDGEGEITARAPLFEETLLTADLVGKKQGAIAPDPPEQEELRRALVLGLRDFGRKCGFSQAALGLSGGIDSALTAAIAVDAFGAKNVACLLMPSPYSSTGSIEDSLALADNLGITTHTLPITPMMETYARAFGAVFPGGLGETAAENIQARIRGALLMSYANRFNALILGTSNKSEVAVGYSTLYGDSCGGISVIGDLYKRGVYALSRWYNERGGKEIIPRAILEKTPSAELRHDQKDSDSLPEYPVLDELLFLYLEQSLSPKELVDAGFDRDMVRHVLHLVRTAEFKRHQAPPVLQISRRAFGPGRRMPIARLA